MKKKRLSVIIIAKDEEENIKDCLESVNFANEIVVVVDDRTTDKTAEIAKNYTDKFYFKKFEGFGKQCQFAFKKATGDWVLRLDADERVTNELKKEILRAIKSKEFSGYHLFFHEVYLGKLMPFRPIGGTERLLKKDKGHFTKEVVHEKLIINGKIGNLQNPIIHHSAPTLSKVITKFNHYTTLEAQLLVEAGAKFFLAGLLLSPPYSFIRRFFFNRGYEWGFRGFIYSFLGAFYHFLKHLKIWEFKNVNTIPDRQAKPIPSVKI